MPAYLIAYQEYDDYAFLRCYSEKEYTQEEFDKIVEGAMQEAIKVFNKSAKYRCEYFEPYEFFNSHYNKVPQAFEDYLAKYDIKHDPAYMSYSITSNNIPKTNPTCNCMHFCMHKEDETFFISQDCRYKDKRIEAIEKLIQQEKNKEKAYQQDPIKNKRLIKECQREIKYFEKDLKELKKH